MDIELCQPTRSLGLLALATIAITATAHAQEDLRPVVEALKDKNAELEARMDALETAQTPGAAAEQSYGLTANYQDVRATFQLFGDAGFGYSDPRPAGFSNSSFTIGAIDAFLTAQMGNHLQVLSESVLTSSTSKEATFAQERLWGAWTFDDRLYAKIGLEHSPISRWSRRYHHGRWLEPTISRPLMADFEGSADGFVPLHNSGLELGGRAPVGNSGNLDYTLIFSNGRGPKPDDKQKVGDNNNSKSVLLALGYSPQGSSLHFGVAAQTDVIPPDPAAAPPLTDDVEQRIGSAFAEGTLAGAELVAEVIALQDETQFDHRTYDHLSWYVQALLPIAPWTPYLRFDVKDMDEGDPYLSQLDRDLDQWRQTLGVRNDFATNAAFKVELGFGERDRRTAAAAVSQETFVVIAFQLSWAI